ncbi:hypothetical protein IWW55_002540, partial [Coemansia sp. RSA 2706]
MHKISSESSLTNYSTTVRQTDTSDKFIPPNPVLIDEGSRRHRCRCPEPVQIFGAVML